MKIKIAEKHIGDGFPTFLVAEAGINHNGSLKTAKKMVEKAKMGGADAIKFQTFKTEDLVSDSRYYKIFKNAELSPEEFAELSDYAKSQNIIFFSTPFSESAVDLLTKLKVPMFKIASGDITHTPLLKYAASTKKPIILSTGMSNLSEVKLAIKSICSAKNNKIILMHSVSSYPTSPSEVNLLAMDVLKEKFSYPVGYSDNGSGILVPSTAVAAGAKIIEKHFTLNKKMKGPDQAFSADPKEFKELVKRIREIELVLGKKEKHQQLGEKNTKMAARRSIIANSTILKGTKIKKEMIKIKRPATGIPPLYFNKIIGMIAKKRIKMNESLKWNDLV